MMLAPSWILKVRFFAPAAADPFRMGGGMSGSLLVRWAVQFVPPVPYVRHSGVPVWSGHMLNLVAGFRILNAVCFTGMRTPPTKDCPPKLSVSCCVYPSTVCLDA